MFSLGAIKITRIILLSLLLLSFPIASIPANALDIHQSVLPDERQSSITILASKQYVVWPDRIQITELTQAAAPPVPSPLPIRFSENPLEVKKAVGKPGEPLLTVYFGLASPGVKGGERKKILGSLKSLRENVPLTVTGYTCDLGGQKFNDRLALERARAVVDLLVRHGVSGKDISVSGKGRCCYADLNNRPLNRRVEIKTSKPIKED